MCRFGRTPNFLLPHVLRKSFTRQNSPGSEVFGFKVPTLNSGIKISEDMTKPGSFYFGFVHLCVNGKTNPVLKRSGFVTNPEYFPLVHVKTLSKSDSEFTFLGNLGKFEIPLNQLRQLSRELAWISYSHSLSVTF